MWRSDDVRGKRMGTWRLRIGRERRIWRVEVGGSKITFIFTIAITGHKGPMGVAHLTSGPHCTLAGRPIGGQALLLTLRINSGCQIDN